MATHKKTVPHRSLIVKLILLGLPLLVATQIMYAEELVSGVVMPRQQAELSFSTTGRITALKPIGSIIKKDEVIARLDNRRPSALLEAAEASVRIAELALQKAQHERDKKGRLSKEEIISDMAITEAKFAVSSAEEELSLNIAQRTSAQVAVADCILRAPYSGVIIDNYLSISETASAGTPVTSFANLSELSLTVDVTFATSDSLDTDTVSTIESDGEIMGRVRVSTMLPLIDPASGLRRIIWTVEESYVDLLAGRYVTITPWRVK